MSTAIPQQTKHLLWSLVALFCVLASGARAATFPVSNMAQLRAAVISANAAPGADTIVMNPGSYVFPAGTVPDSRFDTVVETDGDLDVTDDLTIQGNNQVIDAAGFDRIFHVVGPLSLPYPHLTLENLTLTNGLTDATALLPHGGAVFCFRGNLTLTNCQIVGNSTTANGGGCAVLGHFTVGKAAMTVNSSVITGNQSENGGGLMAALADVTVTGGEISKNTAHATGGTFGGGGILATGTGSNINISGKCSIQGNQCTASTGGGMRFSGIQSASLDEIRINGNSAGTYGGGIYCQDAAQTLTNCIVDGNSAVNSGGAIHCHSNALVDVVNSTFHQNTVGGAGSGGGIYVDAAGTLSMLNPIFTAHNKAAVHAVDPVSLHIVAASLFHNNADGAVKAGGTTYADGDMATLNAQAYAWDNVTGDPLYAGAGDYRIGHASGAHDQGLAQAVRAPKTLTAPPHDYDAIARPVDHPGIGRDGAGLGHEIGAHERVAATIASNILSITVNTDEGWPPINISGSWEVWNSAGLGTVLNYSIATAPMWLSVSPTTGTSSGGHNPHDIGIDPTGLNAGDHPGTITISDPGAGNSPFNIPVTLRLANVLPTAAIDSIAPNPAQPPADVVQFNGTASDVAGTVSVQWSSNLDGPLSTSEDFSKSSNELTVGNHVITLTANDGEGGVVDTTASLTILDAPPTATIVSMSPNPAAPLTLVSITLAGQDNDEMAQSLTSGTIDWPSAGLIPRLPGTYQFHAPPTGGLYTVRYQVEDDEGTLSGIETAQLQVIQPAIAVDPTSLSLTCVEGRICTDTLVVWNAGLGTLLYIADLLPTETMSIVPPGGLSTGPANIHTFTFDAGGLLPGDYAGTITLTDPGASNSPVLVPVSVTVTTGPIIAHDPAALDRCIGVGTDAATQTLEVWNAGLYTLSYIVDTTPSWLLALPPGGFSDGPASRTMHQIGYQTSGLPAGDHPGTITITDVAARNNPVTIPVSLKVGQLIVISPPGGGQWVAGTWQQIEWESFGPCDRVYIDVRRPGGFYRYITSAPNQEGLNSQMVRLPGDLPPAADYVVGISWTCCPDEVNAFSPPLSIQPLQVSITWPTLGTTWSGGMVGNVQWTCSGLPAPSQMYMDIWKGGTYVQYLTVVPCQNGSNSKMLRLPAGLALGTDYQIRLTWVDDTSFQFWSSVFTVAPQPTCTITWPTTGSTWALTTVRDLTFTCADFPTTGQMYLDIWQNGSYVRYFTRVPFVNGNNSIPLRLSSTLTPGANYQMRLTWTTDTGVQSWSGNFTITPQPMVTVTWPGLADSWQAGTWGSLAWDTTNFPPGPGELYVDIWNLGTYERYLTRVPYSGSGSHMANVYLPAGLAPGPDYQVRLTWTTDTGIQGWSDMFTVF